MFYILARLLEYNAHLLFLGQSPSHASGDFKGFHVQGGALLFLEGNFVTLGGPDLVLTLLLQVRYRKNFGALKSCVLPL